MKILIAYDGSIHAGIAIDDLQWAGLPQKAEAVVLSAVEGPAIQAPRSWGMVDTDFSPHWTEQIAAAEGLAEAGCTRLQKLFPQWDVQMETSTGNPGAAILEKAAAWPADLIVVGTHGRSALARVVMGSVSLKVVREAHCSVRVARLSKHDGPIRLLIADDGSYEAEEAVNQVCRRGWPAGTEARILAVQEVLVPANSERIAIGQQLYEKINEEEHFRLRHVAREAAHKLSQAGLRVSSTIEEGDPKEFLVKEARQCNADSIFIGARGLGRVERLLLGSVSSATIAHAPCTVEVVRQS